MSSAMACAVAPAAGILRKREGEGRVDAKLASVIFDSISDGVFTVDEACVITSFNRAAEQITGFTAREAVGRHCFEIFRTEVCHKRCALRDSLASHGPVENARVTIITQEGCEVPISVSTAILHDERGQVVGGVEFFRDLTEVEHLRHRLERDRSLENIVSANPRMRRIIEMLPNIADAECNVLVQGPSGSGKELFAEAIHSLSPRRYGPYIRINCAALPATLLESELFGYVRGAFTDAKRDKPGHFCLANGGTLLLDEIGEMDVALQVKLLRVLNNGEFQPLGSTKALRTDARVIASTNTDLKAAIADGRFREDLFFRINVVTIDLPPLHERPEDLPILIEHFARKVGRRSRKSATRVSPDVVSLLRRYPFPGNVRELENAIEHAFVMCEGGEILPSHLPSAIVEETTARQGIGCEEKNEREVIREALARLRGNRSRAARELGIHRATLWRKIKTLGLDA
jgi:PAS domain S-box-containing protein